MKPLTFHTILLNDNTSAADDLSGIALSINLTQSSPSSKQFCVGNFNEIDFVFSAEGFNEFDVFGLSTGLNEDAQMRLTLVQGLGTFTQSPRKTIVYKSIF